MADTKISDLTGATTPLAGTEEVPLVQSGTTKKTTVADLSSDKVSKVTSTDNAIVRFNGTSGAVQDSSAGVDDNGNITTGGGGPGYYAARSGAMSGGFVIGDGTGWHYDWKDTVGNTVASVDDSGNETIKGNLVIGTSGKGIDFSATSDASGMTSELLSDYEEGTFTPTIILGAGSVTYTTQTGRYTKVGRLVTVQIEIVVNVATTPGSTLEIGGMPFTISATQKGALSIIADGMSASATTTWMGAPTAGSTNLRLYTYAAGNLANPGSYVASGCSIDITGSYEV